jgi:toxin FitB
LSNLLDTSVISHRIKSVPDEKVMRWLSQVPSNQAFLSVVTIQELRTGVELLPAGHKRRNLETWLVRDIHRGYEGRILPITEEIADACGRLIARIKKSGKTPETNDVLLAATALTHGLRIATLNRRHFEGLGVELVEF